MPDQLITPQTIEQDGIPGEIAKLSFAYEFYNRDDTHYATVRPGLNIFELAEQFFYDCHHYPREAGLMFNAIAKWRDELGRKFSLRCDSFVTRGHWQPSVYPKKLDEEKEFDLEWYSRGVCTVLIYLLNEIQENAALVEPEGHN